MNVDMQSIFGCPLPGEPCNTGGFQKGPMDNQTKAVQALLDKVDVASFPPRTVDSIPGCYEKTLKVEEGWSVFRANTKIAYEGRDGSKVFIDFSYQAVTRKVHYEVSQSVKGLEDTPERQSHALGFYFGPNATGNRILNFAKGLVHKFMAMEGDDKEKLAAYIEKLMKAIEKGFGGLHRVSGAIPNHVIDTIRETYDQVMDGMVALKNALVGTQEASYAKLTYEEEITYTSASLEISAVA